LHYFLHMKWNEIVWQPEHKTTKIGILAGIIALTLSIHYGILIEPIFGHVHWVHAIHGRFCYIPIVIAAAWFGMRGGFIVAAAISVLVLPYIISSDLDSHSLADELAEITFYFAIALLAGALIERELKARKRVQDARLQLERSQKLSLVGQIAAGMAHEIKNPLASIKGAVEILGDESTSSEDKEEFRGIVFKEIKRVNGSVSDFLEFARPSETRLRRTDISRIVSESIKQIEVQAKGVGVAISSNLTEGIVVEADSEKIHQVMLNLLINAVEASPKDTAVSVALVPDRDSRPSFAVETSSPRRLSLNSSTRRTELSSSASKTLIDWSLPIRQRECHPSDCTPLGSVSDIDRAVVILYD